MKKVKVDEMTIEGVVYVPKDTINSEQKVIELTGVESLWVVGKSYLIRTVTMIQLGKLEAVTEKELLISNACWVADTGRFSECLADGELSEVEKFSNDVIVGRGAIIDATQWTYELPNETK